MEKVTEVQIKVIKPKEGLLGFASLVLNDSLYLSSIGIYGRLDGSGYRITYPTKKVGYIIKSSLLILENFSLGRISNLL